MVIRWPPVGTELPGRRLPQRAFAFRRDAIGGARWNARESLGELPPTAPSVVLVPGLGAGNYLLHHGARLAVTARVLIPDLPGFGRSRAPSRPRDVVEWADLLAGWHHSVVGRPAGYVGSSFGSQVVACLAARHPEVVTRIALVGPTFDAAARRIGPQLVRWARTSVREPLGLSRKLAISYLQSGPGTPLRGFLAGLAHPTEHDVARIRVPLLLVRGEYDWICGPDWVSRLAAEATDVRMVVMPGAAHTVDYSAPAALAEITGPFLAGTG